ncbi:MAG: AbrB/MazE/SpoVT family DNA-binding domain-containing protein [Sphaerochaetaceae bacterium]|jgi:AbrB family looped-hinge helix DNA binding protein
MEKDGRYIGTAKLGPKGQIVIPKEVRDSFALKAGDQLIILSDPEKGIALHRFDYFSAISDAILSGNEEANKTPVGSDALASAIRMFEKEKKDGRN